MAKLLTANDVKKGQTIFMFGPWNFPYFGWERDTEVYLGNNKWEPRVKDTAYINEVTVHSCGKKRMYLIGTDGIGRGEEFIISQKGTFDSRSFFAATKAEAVELLNEMFKNDEFSTYPYEFIENVK